MRRRTGITRNVITIGLALALAGTMPFMLSGCGNASNGNTSNTNQGQMQASSDGDWSKRTAATVDGHKITEADVNDYISGYRKAYGLTTDSAWATYLDEQSKKASDFRESAVKQIAERYVVSRIAKQDGISITDADIDAKIASVREQSGNRSDDSWKSFLSDIGMTEQQYRDDVRSTLLVRKYAEENAKLQSPSDAQMLAYASNDVSAYTGKNVYELKFTKMASANAAYAKLSGNGVTMDTVKSVSDGNDGSVTRIGWTCFTNMSSVCTTAIANVNAGQCSTVVRDGSNYAIFYVSQECVTGTDGTLDVASMPKELYDALYEDTSSSINANAMQECLDGLLKKHAFKMQDMPKGLPYDIDIKKNSKYNANSNANANGNANAASNASNGQ